MQILVSQQNYKSTISTPLIFLHNYPANIDDVFSVLV